MNSLNIATLVITVVINCFDETGNYFVAIFLQFKCFIIVHVVRNFST